MGWDGSLPARVPADHLPNLIRVTPGVYSGGLPEGPAAFGELRRLGIATVISVDGAIPDVVSATNAGLRYVHLPHGYDGVPAERGHELARAIRDLPGPIYIHCHHGKHRSPAAAAVACIETGTLSADHARNLLALAGTGPQYRGLYRSVESATRVEAAILDRASNHFPEQVPPAPLVEEMIAVDKLLDGLTQAETVGWPSSNRPSDDPTHQALLLHEHFVEMGRLEEVARQSIAFQQSMAEGESAANQLQEFLRQDLRASASQQLKLVRRNCQQCHQQFRDNAPPPGAR
jgi:hypothetical protein